MNLKEHVSGYTKVFLGKLLGGANVVNDTANQVKHIHSGESPKVQLMSAIELGTTAEKLADDSWEIIFSSGANVGIPGNVPKAGGNWIDTCATTIEDQLKNMGDNDLSTGVIKFDSTNPEFDGTEVRWWINNTSDDFPEGHPWDKYIRFERLH